LAFRHRAKWYNFYDPDDVLGYPLKTINADYKKAVTKDIPTNVGVFSHHGIHWRMEDTGQIIVLPDLLLIL
jgi:hypothetical protein